MNTRILLRISVFVAIILAVLFAFFKLAAILFPFVIAYILHFALKPFVNNLEQRGIKHFTAVVSVFSVFFLVFALFSYLFVPAIVGEFMSIQDNIPEYSRSLSTKLSSLENSFLGEFDSFYSNFNGNQKNEVRNLISSFFSDAVPRLLKKLPSLIIGLLPIFLYILVIPFATFFFLLDEYRIKKLFIGMVPNRYFEVTLNLVYSLNRQFGWLLRGMLITAVIMSAIISFLLWFIELEYPIIVGIFSGLSNLIPYAGPVVGVFASFLVALVTGAPNITYLYIILVFVLANLIENIFVQPLVLAKAANLHPLLVIFIVLLGSNFGGILGMLLAVPVASLLQVVIRILYSELKRPIRPDFSKFSDVELSRIPTLSHHGDPVI